MFKKIFWPGSLASGDLSRDVCTLPFPEASSILPATLQGEKMVKKHISMYFLKGIYIKIVLCLLALFVSDWTLHLRCLGGGQITLHSAPRSLFI